MDIIPNNGKAKGVEKPQMEQVEREKQEYKLVGKYLRRKGLRLYAYNSMKGELREVEIKHEETVHLDLDENGQLATKDKAYERAEVNTNDIHFEALNLKNAERRLRKFKEGKIKELCNLREPGNGIEWW